MPEAKTAKRVRLLAAGSIGVALGVMALKYWAWLLTGSVALYSDALESVVNVIAAVVAWLAIGYSMKPADHDHPYGHHKAQYFSAVAEGVLIVLAAIMILREAFPVMMAGGRPIAAFGPGVAVNLSAAAINGFWAVLLLRTGRAAGAPALTADGHHILSDVVTSVGVVAGLVLALATGWLVLDPLLAIVVAINIIWQGWKVIGSSVQGLMDRALPEEEQERIRSIVAENATGAIEFHDLKTREAGMVRFAEFHLIVPAAMTVAESHAICDRIEHALHAHFRNVRTTIHVEPEEKAKEDGIAV